MICLRASVTPSGRSNSGKIIRSIVTPDDCETEEEARKIAIALVEARLAACVNILPGVRSLFRWKGKVQQDAADEHLRTSRWPTRRIEK